MTKIKEQNIENISPTKKEEDLVQNHEEKSEEINGPKGPEPTRYGDWEIGGRTFDF